MNLNSDAPNIIQTMSQNLYELLGVRKDAGPDQIRDAYRKAARQHHPDKGGDTETFKKVQQAYEVLNNDQSRAYYDQTGQIPQEGGGGPGAGAGGFPFPFHMDIGQMFGMFGGGMNAGPGPRRRQRGEKAPHRVERVGLSLAQFYKGHSFEIRFERQKFCDDCKGSGYANRITCTDCNGAGQREQTVMMGPMMMMRSSGPCGKCSGEGQVGVEACLKCKSSGRVGEEKTLNVVVRPGTAAGETFVFEEACSDTAEYAKAGDVHIVLEETEDEHGWRRSATASGQLPVNLEQTITIGLGEALVGKKVALEGHPKCEEVIVEIPPATQNGERLMFPGLGMPRPDGSGHGNLYLTVQVQPKRGEREKIRDEARGYLASLFGIQY